MNFVILKAQKEKNIALECIRTVVAMYGCKVLQLYEYDANACLDKMRTANDAPRIPVHAA